MPTKEQTEMYQSRKRKGGGASAHKLVSCSHEVTGDEEISMQEPWGNRSYTPLAVPAEFERLPEVYAAHLNAASRYSYPRFHVSRSGGVCEEDYYSIGD
jgi:hypothetical protein